MKIIGHPAPGLGVIQAGWFSVPQNPLQPSTYTPGIGEILDASFVVPQNPVMDYTKGKLNLIGRDPHAPGVVNGVSGIGDCGCSGSCGGCNEMNGLGTISDDWTALTAKITAGDYTGAIQAPIMGIPAWALIGGGVIAAMALSGGMGSGGGRRR